MNPEEAVFDYVVIGTGAGGGPLAAALAQAGMKVLVLEAGNNEDRTTYSVPGFHGLSTEDETFRWDYFVRHYGDEQQQSQDPKLVPSKNAILYPRASGVGGSTIHNAMITVYPANSDWDRIAEITGDETWNSDHMRDYFQRIENCHYLTTEEIKTTRHGASGWYATEKPDTTGAAPDDQLKTTLLRALAAGKEVANLGPIGKGVDGAELQAAMHQVVATSTGEAPPESASQLLLDPNSWQVAVEKREGFHTIPLGNNNHARNGTREYLRAIAQQYPDNLVIQTQAFATQILFDENNTAIGVEYLSGAHLYRADPRADSECSITAPTRQQVYINREVILACGAFNTPQLLKLSGIGPRDELASFGIPVRVDLPGVGENLQDRYEIGVIYEMASEFTISKEAIYSDNPDYDKILAQWLETRTGVYTTNGAALAFMKRSTPEKENPDLYVFGFASHFEGYFPQWFSTYKDVKDQFTWAILKGYTHCRTGTVKLRSADPLDTPEINFHYFNEGDPDGEAGAEDDLNAVVDGIKFARALMKNNPYVSSELIPGAAVESDDQLKTFIRNQTWGHHCSCTARIGAADDPMAVLDSRFRVYGTQNLRVVDASVFPYIPGLFIVTPIYMISEKAADVILEDARQS